MSGKIAIVGAGPSGCYVAQSLLKADPGLAVDVIDALPVPYGLVRYGVASDHQGTKAVARQFARIFERQGARFFGNVRIGRDVSLDALRASYDAVVLAAGLPLDRRLGIPGDDMPGIVGSAALTRALHEHPDAPALPALGSDPVIVGNGNVAMDIVRVLCKSAAELEGSDLGDAPSDWLARNALRSITVVGRSPASRARFDPLMVRELGKLGNVAIDVVGADESDDPESMRRLEALSEIHGRAEQGIRVTFRFGLTPVAVEGEGHVTGLVVDGPDGRETIAASSIVTAIGFAADAELGHDALKLAADDAQSGKLADRLYCAGWFRTGPRGVIPDSRAHAKSLAQDILSELTIEEGRAGSRIFAPLADIVDYEGWQRIDAAELASASPQRSRRKLATRNDMLKAALQEENR